MFLSGRRTSANLSSVRSGRGMCGQISTLVLVGIEARPVELQVRITPGQRAFVIVGLPDKAVAESRERSRSAL